jgi:hypothetical protein
MSACAVTRRATIVRFLTFAFLSSEVTHRAQGQPIVRFRNIRVDVSPLRASAGDPTADWVERELPRDLAKSLAANLSPDERDGATLVVRIEYIFLGSGGGPGQSGGSPDSIQGVLIVRRPRDRTAAETPLRATTSYYPDAADQALIEEAYHQRVVALAQAFAGWAPRQLGL